MTQREKILKYNQRCAKFLGWVYNKKSKTWAKKHSIHNKWVEAASTKTFMFFYNDWNRIMEVVEAIEKFLPKTEWDVEFDEQSKIVLL